MRRWNGWGDESNVMDLPSQGEQFLIERIGKAVPLDDASFEEVMKQVPETRLAAHPLIDTSKEQRIRHARGQSLPDWLAMRSGAFDYFPDGVAFPEFADQVDELIDYAKQHDVVLIPYGGGTSVVGHINPFESDRPILTIDMGRMNRLIELEPESQIATFGAGTPGPLVESQLRAKGYTLGHFPQSFELSTVGGWVASRSSGQQSLRYGRIEQLFAGGLVHTPKGRMPLATFPASSAGTDLRELFMGSEGRMGIISEVKVRVTPLPESEKFYVLFFPSWSAAKFAAQSLVQSKVVLSMLRLSNAIETETQLALAGHPTQIALLEKFLAWRGAGDGKCMMTLGITGNHQQNKVSLSQMRKLAKSYKGVFTGTYLGSKWEQKRFTMPYLRESLWRLGYVVDTLETATDWENTDNLVGAIEGNLKSVLGEGSTHVFTHLSHFYAQGSSIYTTYVFKAGASYEETLENWRKLKTTTSEIIVRNQGTISHQHGVGRDHAPYLETEKGTLGIQTMSALLSHFDDQKIMNPGCLIEDQS